MAASRRDQVCATRNRLLARYLGRSRVLPPQRTLPTHFPKHIRCRRHRPQRRRSHTLFLSSRNPLPLLRPHSPPPLQRLNKRTTSRTIRPFPRPKRHLRRPRNRHQWLHLRRQYRRQFRHLFQPRKRDCESLYERSEDRMGGYAECRRGWICVFYG